MSTLNRRDFLNNQLKNLLGASLFGLTSCFEKEPISPFSLYWIHLEGAPLRSLFDLFLDPFNHDPSIFSPAPLKSFSHKFGTYKVPEVWFDNNVPSLLLKNILSVRGLSSASPHLKQCRGQWFEQDSFKDLFTSLPPEKIKNYTWLSQTPALSKIYRDILPFNPFSLNDLPIDSKALDHKEVLSSLRSSLGPAQIRLALINQFAPNKYFENTSSLNDDDIQLQLKFYKDLIKEIELLVESLKKRELFDKSAILITSDRARVITNPNDQEPYKTEPMWQGLNFSLISGLIGGPQTIGHIKREHPRYSESFPGTWGVGTENWTPRHVHQLIADLCFPKGYYDQAKWVSQNPWLDRKPMGRFMIKQGPGLVL